MRVTAASLALALVLGQVAAGPDREAVIALPDPAPVRIGLALSGGAALGLAHIGVLKVLERERIPVAAISGNSMGSMVGGMYAAGYSAAQIESTAVNADWGVLFSSGVPFGARYLPERQQAQRYVFRLRHRNFLPSLPGGLLPLQNVEFLLMDLLSEIEYNTAYDFDSLPIPYRAVAVDLDSGRLAVLDTGRLEQAIRASIAIPGVFSPEKLRGMHLVDGGVQRYLPVEEVDSLHPGFVIAVLTMKRNPETGMSLIDIVSRTMDVVTMEDTRRQMANADVVIEPNVDPFMHSDFAHSKELIAAGEVAAESALPEIRARLAGRRPLDLRRPVLERSLPVVRSVRLDGLKTTRAGTLMPLVRTRPGQRLDFSQLRTDLVRIFNTGLFEDVNYRLEPGPGDSVNLVIDMLERAYGFYALGIRYDNSDAVALGLEAGQGNLGGSGASARAALNLGNPTEVRLGLTGTRLFLLPFGYRLDGFWSSIDRTLHERGRWLGTYTTQYRGGIAEAGYILGRNGFFDVGLTGYSAAHRFPAGLAADAIGPELVVGPTLRIESSTFPDIDFPTRGAAWRLGVLYSVPALKATGNFLKFDYSSERVLPLGSRLLLRPGLDAGFSLGRLAWVEHFRTGAGEFAGFAKDEFTTAQRLVVRAGFDIRLVDLFGQSNYPLFLQVTGNAGTFRRADSLVRDARLPDDLHWGAGIGLRTNSPLGPFQFSIGVGDFAHPAADRPTRVNFLLSVGREFRYTR